MRTEAHRRAFILAHTRLLEVPNAPEIRLHIADEATELWARTEAELQEIGLPPPYWAFAWAGGQGLARYLLDNPEAVRGARVLDVASGSGLVAIAAARAGARATSANDIDPFALTAIALNATANDVSLGVIEGDVVGTSGWDVVLAADIFYERDTAARVTGWLVDQAARGARVLVGDPGRTYFARDTFEAIATYAVPVARSLEGTDSKTTRVWRLPRVH